MNALLTPWPREMPRVFRPMARFRHDINLRDPDMAAMFMARRRADRESRIRNSTTTGTISEQMFVNTADYSAFNNSAAEGSLLSGVNEQPVIPALFFFNKQGRHRTVRFEASGVLSTTSTPTIIFQWRAGTTSGSSFLSGTSIGVSGTITTASGVTNKWWSSILDLQCNTTGIGTGNTTLSGAGYVTSPGGFASPFIYPLEPTTPDTATWTSTIDNSVNYFINLSVTWGTQSSSNTITLKKLWAFGMN